MPEPPASIASATHPLISRAHNLATAYPQNMVRFQAITEARVFRFTHSRAHALTWLDQRANVLWVVAVDGRDTETYDHFENLHRRGELLPSSDDHERHNQERALALARTILNDVPRWLRDARAHPGQERAYELVSGGPAATLLVREDRGVQEVWCALPTLLAPVVGLPVEARALILAVLTEELGGATVPWEQRYDWPGRDLRAYDVAYFWLA